MAAVHAIATSEDGQWIAWSEAGRLVVVDAAKRLQAGELAIELQAPVALALSTDPYRLVVVQTRGASTLVRVLSVPELEPLAEGTLSASARLVAVCGAKAVLLGGADVLTLLDLATLHSTTLTIRGPIQAVASFSASQVLIAARGKLEAWSLDERRPTHRLAFALPKQPAAVGVAANGTLLWTASADAPGAVSCYRLADGALVSEAEIGGRPLSVTASSTEPTLIAVVQGAPTELVVIALLTGERRTVAVGAPIAAACLVHGDAGVLTEHGESLQVALAGAEAIRPLAVSEGVVASAAQPTDTAAAAPPPVPQPVVSRLDEWRAQVHEAVRLTTATAPGTEGRRTNDEPRSRTRAELVAWAETARNRKSTAPPPPPQVWKLSELVQRFSLDLRSRALLSLLYASWLDGDGKVGMPVAQVARVLGNDEQAWIDALAHGRLGKLGWVRASFGRLHLRAQVGRFLDEAPGTARFVAPAAAAARTVDPPSVASLWGSGSSDSDLDTRLRELADVCSVVVAAIDLDAMPTARFERALEGKLLECRLHGALPVLHSVGGVLLDVTRLAEPMLLTCSGTAPSPWRQLPSWPPAVTHEAAG